MPKSIYTLHSFKAITHPDYLSLNKKQVLSSYSFVSVDKNDVDLKLSSLDFIGVDENSNLSNKEDYKRFQDASLWKNFLRKNDPTRWNLQCAVNRIQPSSSNN